MEIAGILNDHTSGAAEIARRAAETLMRVGGRAEAVRAAQAIAHAHASMAPLERLARVIEQSTDIPRACREFLDRLESADARIAESAADLIRDGACVMTHSASGTVERALSAAAKRGRRFTVIATESRPMCEGAGQARRLVEAGIETTLVVDAAVARHMPDSSLALMGADRVTPRVVVNKIGTWLLARAAKEFGKPVYVLASTLKFAGETVEEEPKPEKELKPPPGVRAANYYFESVPIEWFAGVITEEGIYAQNSSPSARFFLR